MTDVNPLVCATRLRRPQTGPCAINKGQFDKLTDRSQGVWSLSLSKGPPAVHRLCQLRLCGVPFLFLLSPPVLHTLILALLASILQQVMIADDSKHQKVAEASPIKLWHEMPYTLRNLLLSDILIRFCERIPDAFVVIWATRFIAQPVSELTFGFLSAIESITAVIIYFPVAYFADRFGKKRFVLITFLFFTSFPLVLLYSHPFDLLLVAFVVRGLKEFGEPTRKALIMDLAPEGRKTAMFGLYYLIRDVLVAFAAFGGALLWQHSPELNLKVAFVFGILGSIWFARYGSNESIEVEKAI